MNILRAYSTAKTLGATIVLTGLVLCTVHLGSEADTLAAAHHSTPHTTQCIDTCIDHVPAVPTIHARTATTVTPDTPYTAHTTESVVLPRVTELAALPEIAQTTRNFAKLYLYYSVLRV